MITRDKVRVVSEEMARQHGITEEGRRAAIYHSAMLASRAGGPALGLIQEWVDHIWSQWAAAIEQRTLRDEIAKAGTKPNPKGDRKVSRSNKKERRHG